MAKQAYDGFSRSSHRTGGVRSSYAGAVSKNAARKSNELLRKTLLGVLLCVILPPLGIYAVCSQRDQSPIVKAVCTCLAAVVMVFLFYAMIPSAEPRTVTVDRVAPQAIAQPTQEAVSGEDTAD